MMNWMGSNKDDYEEKNRISSYRGYLLKMRRSNNLLAPQWGKRWFSIEGRFLRWYRLDTDNISSGMIDLRQVRSITKVDISGAFTFCVTCEDRNLIMRASSVTEMNGWIRALHMQADIARGGSGTNVVSDFNDMPLSHAKLFAKRSSKGRGPLTIEQQLDQNLRKLNELEQELLTNTEDLTPTSTHYGRSHFAEDEKMDTDDSPSDSHLHRSKAGKMRSSTQNRNPLAEAPSAAAQYKRVTIPNRTMQSLTGSNVARVDSNDSLENLPAQRGGRSYDLNVGRTRSEEYGAKLPSQQQGPYVQSLGHRSMDESDPAGSYEGDLNPAASVSAGRKVPVHTGGKHMPTTASIYSHPQHGRSDPAVAASSTTSSTTATSAAAPAQSGARSERVRRLRATSNDSLDSVEFSYIPDISEEKSSVSPDAKVGGSAVSRGKGGTGWSDSRGAKTAWV